MLILVPSHLEFAALFPDLPGEGTSRAPVPWGERHELCLIGVGLAASGACSGVAMVESSQQDVLLVGLAGSLALEGPGVCELVVGSHVELDGIGFGSGADFLPLQDASGPLTAERDSAARLPLVPLAVEQARTEGLLSVCAASATAEEAAFRRERYRDCAIEDMESWAVARAAASAGKSLSVLRAVSNEAGDRNHAAWKIGEALEMLREALAGLPEPSRRAGAP